MSQEEAWVYRIIDANLNRAREGLRVIEEVIRFIVEDTELLNRIKSLRHELTQIFKEKKSNLIHARNSNQDIGKDIDMSKNIKSIKDIISANINRVQEALRVIEEFYKLLNTNTNISNLIKNIRFKTYSLEKELYLIIDEK
jgi:thiamine-phosphate pyrophosphorylase